MQLFNYLYKNSFGKIDILGEEKVNTLICFWNYLTHSFGMEGDNVPFVND